MVTNVGAYLIFKFFFSLNPNAPPLHPNFGGGAKARSARGQPVGGTLRADRIPKLQSATCLPGYRGLPYSCAEGASGAERRLPLTVYE